MDYEELANRYKDIQLNDYIADFAYIGHSKNNLYSFFKYEGILFFCAFNIFHIGLTNYLDISNCFDHIACDLYTLVKNGFKYPTAKYKHCYVNNDTGIVHDWDEIPVEIIEKIKTIVLLS